MSQTSAEKSKAYRERKARELEQLRATAGAAPPALPPGRYGARVPHDGAVPPTPKNGHSRPSSPPPAPPAPGPLPIHETPRLEGGGYTPDRWTAVPLVPPDPEAGEGAAPAAAVPPVPPAGPTPEQRTAAAEKFAGAVLLLYAMGAGAAKELAGDLVVPEQFAPVVEMGLASLTSEATLGYIRGCAERVALKYNLTVTVPFEDELVVLGASAASIVALAAQWKRRHEPPREEGGPDVEVRNHVPEDAKPAGAPAQDWSMFGLDDNGGNR